MRKLLLILILTTFGALASECNEKVTKLKESVKETDFSWREQNTDYVIFRVLDELQTNDDVNYNCYSIYWALGFIRETYDEARLCLHEIKTIRKDCEDGTELQTLEKECKEHQGKSDHSYEYLYRETDQYYQDYHCDWYNDPPDIDWG